MAKAYPLDIITEDIGSFTVWHLRTFVCLYWALISVDLHRINFLILAADVMDPQCKNDSLDLCDISCKEYTYNTTILDSNLVSEFNLVCEDYNWVYFAHTVLILGMIVGGFVFGTMADIFGRRPVMLMVCWLQLVGFAAPSVEYFAMFCVVEFCIGLPLGGFLVVGFALAMEIVGPKHRGISMVYLLSALPVSWSVLYIITIWMRHWRWLYFGICFHHLCYMAYYWLIPESPRWLFTTGRVLDAIDVLQKAAEYAHKYPHNIHSNLMLAHKYHDEASANVILKSTANEFYNFGKLSSAAMILSFCYFAYSFNVYSLILMQELMLDNKLTAVVVGSGGRLIGVLLSALFLLLPSRILSCALGIIGTTISVLTFALTGSIEGKPMHRHILTIGSCLALAFSQVQLTHLTLLCAESFPTSIRCCCFAYILCFASFGRIMAPLLLGLPPLVGFGACGFILLLSAFLLCLLKETAYQPLPENWGEVHHDDTDKQPEEVLTYLPEKELAGVIAEQKTKRQHAPKAVDDEPEVKKATNIDYAGRRRLQEQELKKQGRRRRNRYTEDPVTGDFVLKGTENEPPISRRLQVEPSTEKGRRRDKTKKS